MASDKFVYGVFSSLPLRQKIGTTIKWDGLKRADTVGTTGTTPASTTAIGESATKRSPDHLFYNATPLVNKDFYPFGKRPFVNDMFYIGDEEAFSKKCRMITIFVFYAKGDQIKTEGNREIAWEYSDGKKWQRLDVDQKLVNQSFTFTIPCDINKTTVNNVESYWIRARIASGDYGTEKYTVTRSSTDSNTFEYGVSYTAINAPQISYLAIGSKEEFREIEQVITYNNLEYKDYTASVKNSPFRPFELLEEEKSSLFLGINKKIDKSPISIYFDIDQSLYISAKKHTIRFYYYDGVWKKLQIDDKTDGLTKSGEIKILLPPNFAKSRRFEQSLYWLKISHSDELLHPRKINGMYLNTVTASNRETIQNEFVGSSNNLPGQKFEVKKISLNDEPVKVWIKEPFLLDSKEREVLLKQQEIFEVKDDQQNILEQWTLWKNIPSLDDSKPKDRHFEIDKVIKKIKFGDSQKGKIPPIGFNNIKVDYVSGGGYAGNLSANTITSLVNAIPFVSLVNNPLPAGGGVDKETIEHLLVRAPHSIRNRERAIAADDFEWLIQEHFPSIVKSKCFSATRADGVTQGGYVTVAMIQFSTEKRPIPNRSLLEDVQTLLQSRCSFMLSPQNVQVVPPKYLNISVKGDVYSSSIENIPIVEKMAYEALDKFFHPLSGRKDSHGWNFGDLVCLSEVYQVLEEIPEVKHVENLSFTGKFDESGIVFSAKDSGVESGYIPPHVLVCSGEHNLKVVVDNDNS